jgi:Zn-dependent M16 (insulinase) family peptidase
MVSYRDPQIEKTYEAYNALSQKISTMSIGDSELKQLIIGTYGNFTPHNGPATKGALARNDLLSGITKEFRKNRIQEILATSQQDLIQFARYFERLQSKSYRATIGSKTKIEKADKLFKAIEIL